EVQVTAEERELVEGEIQMGEPKEIVPEAPEEAKPESETPVDIETVKKVKKIKRKESKPELVIPESKDIEETSEVQVTAEERELEIGRAQRRERKEIVPEAPEEAKPESETPVDIETVKKVKKIKRKESKPELVI